MLYHAWVLATPRRMVIDVFGIALDFTPLFSAGWAGVQMFFVLSGFLLAQPFVRWQSGLGGRPDTVAYLGRRVRRVFPAYYAQILLLAGIAWAGSGHWPIDTWSSALRHLTMLFVPLPVGGEPLNGIWWSLPVEFMFYLLLPLLACGLRPARAAWLLVACLAIMASWRFGTATLLADEPIARRFIVGSQMPGMLDSFGIGMVGAIAHVHSARWPRAQRLLASPWTPLAGLIAIIACLYWIHYGFRAYWANSVIFYTWTPAFGGAMLAVTLAAAAGNRLTERLFGNRVVVFVGLVSYSIYLWHMPILDAVRAQLAAGHHAGHALLPLLGAALLFVMPAAWLSWRLVERPFHRPGDEATRRNGTASAVPPPL